MKELIYFYVFRPQLVTWEISLNSHHVSLEYQQGKTLSFVLKCFFGELSYGNDAGISFQILAPTLEKALFWISSPDI